jgi:signal peptidase I
MGGVFDFKAIVLLSLLLSLSQAAPLIGVIGYTGSMVPTYSGGEEVLLIQTNNADIGDVIVFEKDDRLVVHRVIFEFNGCYITKGDAVWLPDWGCSIPRYVVI